MTDLMAKLDAASTANDASSAIDDMASTTKNAALATPQAPTIATEKPPIERFLVFDDSGRLLIDVVNKNDDGPHGKSTRRHRCSLDAMKRASPAWKSKIFGSEGEERPELATDDEDRAVVLDDDPPRAITMQLALIHERPELVPRFHNNPDTQGVCMFIYEFMTTADRYGVLPLFRPFVSHWLPHARPTSEDMDRHYVHRMEAAWQLGAVGLVQDHVRKLVYHTIVTPELLDQARARSLLACKDGFLTSLPGLFDTVGKRQRELVQSLLDLFHEFLVDLRGEEGICQQALPGTPEHERCNAGLEEFVSKRMAEPTSPKIPLDAKDCPLTIHQLLHITTHIMGVSCKRPGPKQVDRHKCVSNLHKRIVDLGKELLGRWKGEQSILEPEQLEWLTKRGEILGTETSSV